jgi:hypothetical protein
MNKDAGRTDQTHSSSPTPFFGFFQLPISQQEDGQKQQVEEKEINSSILQVKQKAIGACGGQQ